jgi:hypothetical protein
MAAASKSQYENKIWRRMAGGVAISSVSSSMAKWQLMAAQWRRQARKRKSAEMAAAGVAAAASAAARRHEEKHQWLIISVKAEENSSGCGENENGVKACGMKAGESISGVAAKTKMTA